MQILVKLSQVRYRFGTDTLQARLSDTSDDILYGVEEAGEGPRQEALSARLYERFLSVENHIIGTFCLEILEEKYSLVYDSSEIRLVRISLYSE